MTLNNPVESVAHFCGRMFAAGTSEEAQLASEIQSLLAQQSVCAGVGALACGSDILIAEALLKKGAELHVVLPFDIEHFVAVSVDPGGVEWTPRFHACLAQATQTQILSLPPSRTAFRDASHVAIKETLQRARANSATAIQVAVFDGVASRDTVGTAGDIQAWEKLGYPTFVVQIPRHLRLNSAEDTR